MHSTSSEMNQRRTRHQEISGGKTEAGQGHPNRGIGDSDKKSVRHELEVNTNFADMIAPRKSHPSVKQTTTTTTTAASDNDDYEFKFGHSMLAL